MFMFPTRNIIFQVVIAEKRTVTALIHIKVFLIKLFLVICASKKFNNKTSKEMLRGKIIISDFDSCNCPSGEP